MKNLGKRGLALFLSLVMLVSLVPTAFAEEAYAEPAEEAEIIAAEPAVEETPAEEPVEAEEVEEPAEPAEPAEEAEEPAEEAEEPAEELPEEDVITNDAADANIPQDNLDITISVENSIKGVTISWTYNDVSGNYPASKYVVMRKSSASGSYTNIYTTADDSTTTYVDKPSASNSGTTYYYNVKVVSATAGNATGYKESNCVANIYLAPVTISTAVNTADGIKLTWTAVNKAGGYYIYRTTDGNFGTDLSSAEILNGGKKVTGTTYTDTTPSVDTVYYYLVRAVSQDDGTYGCLNLDDAGVGGTACVHLSVPVMTKSNVNNTTTGVELTWTAVGPVTDGKTGETKTITYRVYRMVKGTGTWVLRGSTDTNSYTDKADSGTAYYYAVSAYDETDKIEGQHETLGILNYYLSAPALGKPVNGTSSVTISWTTVTGATSYDIYRRPAASSTTFEDTDGSPLAEYWLTNVEGATSYVDTTGEEGVEYYYTVIAKNNDDRSAFNKVGVIAYKITVPVMISATNETNGIAILWKTGSSSLAGYNIYRRLSGGSTWEKIASQAPGDGASVLTEMGISSTTTEAYLDDTAEYGKTYEYTVTSYIGINNESGFGQPVKTVTRLAVPVLGNLSNPDKSIVNDKTGITICWNTVSGAAGYKIYRAVYDTDTGDWGPYYSIDDDVSGTSYTDTSVVSGTSYMYSVSAKKGTSYSKYDEIGLTIERVVHPDFTVNNYNDGTDDGVLIEWPAVNGAEEYRVYRKLSTDKAYVGSNGSFAAGYETVTASGNATEQFFDKEAKTIGKTYVYTVRAVGTTPVVDSLSWYDVNGKSIVYIAGHVYGVAAENATNGIKITWDKMNGATKYKVYRKVVDASGNSLGDFVALGTVSTCTYTDTKAAVGVHYKYLVRGVVGNVLAGWDEADTTSPQVAICTYLKTPNLLTITNTITSAGDNSITLTWSPVTGADSYLIMRKIQGQSGWSTATAPSYTEFTAATKVTVDPADTTEFKEAKNTNGTLVDTWVDDTVVKGYTYTYTVIAMDSASGSKSCYNNTGKSLLVLDVPTCSSAVGDAKGIVVTWQPCAGAKGYQILRRTESTEWTVVKKVTGEYTSTYTDTSAKAGNYYYYTVAAYVGSTVGAYKDVNLNKVIGVRLAKITLVKAENATADDTQDTSGIKISWKAITDPELDNVDSAGVLKFRIHAKLNYTNAAHDKYDKVWDAVISPVEIDAYDADGNQVTSYVDTTVNGIVVNGGSVSYTVEAYVVDSNGVEHTGGYNTSGTSCKFVPAPTGVSVSTTTDSKGVDHALVTWTEWDDSTYASETGKSERTASSYVIYRKLPGQKYQKLGTVKGSVTEFTVKNTVEGQEYQYVVRTVFSGTYSGYPQNPSVITWP